MGEREEKIIDTAISVFCRYGVKRTTMNDIAGEAGIVRQTLYNVYANKEEILRAVIQLSTDRALAAIEAGCAEADTLGDKLDIVFDYMAVRPFEMLSATPHADEIISGVNDAAKEEISSAYERYRVVIENLLVPYETQIRSRGMTTNQLSDFIRYSVKGFKLEARDKKHLMELLDSLKLLVLMQSDTAKRAKEPS